MFSRLAVSFVALSMLLMMVSAQSHSDHGINEMHKRGKPKGRGGRATWFHPGLGNCGGYNKDNDMIVALPTKAYGNGQYCGKKVKLTNKKTGKSCTATVVDSCPGCGGSDLGKSSSWGWFLLLIDSVYTDVSPNVFKALAKDLGQGVATIDWDFV